MPVTPPAKTHDPFKDLRPYLEGEDERRKKRITAVRAYLEGGAGLNEADKKSLVQMSYFEFPEAITAHKGHGASVKQKSLSSALRLFRASSTALLALLDEFHDYSGTPEFNYPANQDAAEEIETRILKEVFTFSELAHSVQDHCRRVRKVWKPADWHSRLATHFGQDALHDFVLGLRGVVHHITMFEPNWELRWNGANERSSHYLFKKKELLEDCEKWEKGEVYLLNAPEKIDVRDLVIDYVARHNAFYAWFMPWCEANPPNDVAEYREVKLEHRRHVARMEFRFLLKELVKRKIDPMPHLSKYLRAADLAQALQLPAHSPELANFVIERYDREGACDAEIRLLVYELFGIAGPAAAP